MTIPYSLNLESCFIASRAGRCWLALSLLLWMAMVVGGFAQLLRYEGQPGTTTAQTSAGPETFPATCLLEFNPRGQTLLMFAHPHCACSRASLSELAAILVECPDLQPVQIVFPVPAGATAAWKQGKIAQEAATLAGVRIVWDQDEELARLFQAKTSGHVLLFAANGTRLFSGGITGTRGHAGWNAGRGAIVALHKNQPGVRSSTPVFGCQLSSDKSPGDSRL
jgi:hypothetical protein